MPLWPLWMVSRMAERSTVTSTETYVRHIARPSGRERANPPNLGDLRAFVAAAEGLPDDLHVFIERGHVGEGGRHNTTLTVRYREPTVAALDGAG